MEEMEFINELIQKTSDLLAWSFDYKHLATVFVSSLAPILVVIAQVWFFSLRYLQTV
ncbi:MAG: hypothetical protein ACFFBD_12265 [Candidatus Hodarchaeota archaeon]